MMRHSLFIPVLLFALLAVLVGPAHSAVYVWKDANGIMNFADHPGKIPPGVKVEVRTYYDEPAPVADVPSSDVVTQGAFAHQLAAELGLGEGLTPKAAARVLSRVRIAPRLGAWDLDAPMEQGLLTRLRTLTVAAAYAGRLPLEPGEAVLAFDSAAALVGIALREVAPDDVPPSTRRFLEEPVPSVYVEPPPAVIHERVIVLGGDVIPVHEPLVHPHKIVINVDKRVIRKPIVHRRPVRKFSRRNVKHPHRLKHKFSIPQAKKHGYYPQPRQPKVHRQHTTTLRVRTASRRLLGGKRAVSTRGRAGTSRASAGSVGTK
ncbi:MAG: DUF4124 domain-containing protein [Acidiferrobacterales bacterium]